MDNRILSEVKNRKKNMTYYVNSTFHANLEDGSAQYPFKKINGALDHATDQHVLYHILLAPGIYEEDIEVSSSVELLGSNNVELPTVITGTIHNKNAHYLRIANIKFLNSPEPGAIIIDHPSSNTEIFEVTIENSTRYGICQKGGNIHIKETTVVNTKPGQISELDKIHKPNEVISYGTGIFLTEVRGSLENTKLSNNIQGLVADGKSVLNVDALKADNHKTNTELKETICKIEIIGSGLSTIEALNGAELQMKNIVIHHGEFVGISIHDGASAKIDKLTVLYTKGVLCSQGNLMGGINISVRRGGAKLEVSNFDTGYSDMLGLQVVDAYCKMTDGRVHDNPIGAGIKGQINSFDDLQVGVTWMNNQRNVDIDSLPVPDSNISV